MAKDLNKTSANMTETGMIATHGSGFVAGFGFIASSTEDLQLAQAFKRNLLKALGACTAVQHPQIGGQVFDASKHEQNSPIKRQIASRECN